MPVQPPLCTLAANRPRLKGCARRHSPPPAKSLGHLHGQRSGVQDSGMATYDITPRPDRSGFDIAIADDDGGRHTMLGFKTEVDAEAWIIEDQRLAGYRGPQEPPS